MSLQTFLISFCNNKEQISRHGLQLAVLEIDSTNKTVKQTHRTIELPEGLEGNGVTGMCYHNQKLVLMLQRNPSTLLFLNQQLQVEQVVPMEGLKGVHTILSWHDELVVSVTRQDRIVRLDGAFKQHEVWSTGSMHDTIHLNSLCVHQNRLYATAFGQKKDQLWSSADQGYVFDVATSEPMIKPIWHPHSLVSYDGQLCCCHSTFQQVISAQGVVADQLPGYTRGLYLDDELLICGLSIGRLVSHSTGIKISNQTGVGKRAGSCGVYVRFADQTEALIDLSHLGSEVFEVMLLQPAWVD